MDRTSHSRSRREGGGRVGNLECWGGDCRFPGGRMTLCGMWRFWDVDGVRPCGRMNSCGSYGGEYISRGRWVGVHNNK